MKSLQELLSDVHLYLPKHFTKDTERQMLVCISELLSSEGLKSGMYINIDPSGVLQGDGIKDLAVANLPSTEVKRSFCMVLSNSCDIDSANGGMMPTNVVYASILPLNRYQSFLREKGFADERINQNIADIRRQSITNVFHLPQGDNFEESIVLLDRVNSCSTRHIEMSKLKENRLFSLSQFGFWLFILKLSYHFTRVRENLDRNQLAVA